MQKTQRSATSACQNFLEADEHRTPKALTPEAKKDIEAAIERLGHRKLKNKDKFWRLLGEDLLKKVYGDADRLETKEVEVKRCH